MGIAEFNQGQERDLLVYLTQLPVEWKKRDSDMYLDELVQTKKEKTTLLGIIRKSKRMLDLGCGFGYAMPSLMEMLPAGSILVGVDIDEKAIAGAKRNVQAKGTGGQILQMDEKTGIPDRLWDKPKNPRNKWLLLYQTDAAGRLRCKEDTFDLIISVQAFRYFMDKITALVNVLKLLKQGGVAYLGVGVNDIILLEEAPPQSLLDDVQNQVLAHKYWHPAKVLSTFFSEKMPHKVLSVTDFINTYLNGVIVEHALNLKIKKDKTLSKKMELPVYYSFLIGNMDEKCNYGTVSLYIKSKK